MKVAIFVLGLTFSSYASSMDYSQCAKVVSNLGQLYNDSFVSMNEKTGEIEVHRGKGSMRTEGNNVIYNDYKQDVKIKASNDVRVVTFKKMTDKEELILTYEKIEKGSAPEKLKSITYNFKDSSVTNGASFKVELHEKNGICVPETKSLDVFSGFGKVTRFLTTKVFTKGTKAIFGAKDIYKCRELYEELRAMDDLKNCMASAPKLQKLNQLTMGILFEDDKKANAPISEKDKKEYEEKIKTAFQAYSSAEAAVNLCGLSGYAGVYENDAYWAKVKAPEDKEEVKTDSTSR